MKAAAPAQRTGALRRTVLIVALLNVAYFFVEFGVAIAADSFCLLADSVDLP